MSRRAEIAERCREGRLFEFPGWGVEANSRRLFVSPLVNQILQPQAWNDEEVGNLYVAANGRLEAYAGNKDIPFGWVPDKKKPHAAFSRVKPVEKAVIAIRAWKGTQHIRLFGCFSEKDWFVVLRWDFRTGIDFKKEIEECRKDWSSLFTFPPHQGNSVHDYISCKVTSV